jgi:hypothetical protein
LVVQKENQPTTNCKHSKSQPDGKIKISCKNQRPKQTARSLEHAVHSLSQIQSRFVLILLELYPQDQFFMQGVMEMGLDRKIPHPRLAPLGQEPRASAPDSKLVKVMQELLEVIRNPIKVRFVPRVVSPKRLPIPEQNRGLQLTKIENEKIVAFCASNRQDTPRHLVVKFPKVVLEIFSPNIGVHTEQGLNNPFGVICKISNGKRSRYRLPPICGQQKFLIRTGQFQAMAMLKRSQLEFADFGVGFNNDLKHLSLRSCTNCYAARVSSAPMDVTGDKLHGPAILMMMPSISARCPGQSCSAIGGRKVGSSVSSLLYLNGLLRDTGKVGESVLVKWQR